MDEYLRRDPAIFTPREIHVTKILRVVITYVDGQGNLETLVSPPSQPVQNVNDKPTGSPILTGSAMEEDALVVDTSTIADEDGIGTYEVIWQRSSTKTEWQNFPDANTEVLRLARNMWDIPIAPSSLMSTATIRVKC